MNFKITLILACLVSAGVGTWIWLNSREKPVETRASASIDFFKNKLKSDQITRIEVARPLQSLGAPRREASTVALLAQPFSPLPLLAASTAYPRWTATRSDATPSHLQSQLS